jgi:hypothetical protein
LRGRVSSEYSRYYSVGVKNDKKLIVVEQGERGDAMLFSIYEHRRFENMLDDSVRHYPPELLRSVAYKLALKKCAASTARCTPSTSFCRIRLSGGRYAGLSVKQAQPQKSWEFV